MSNISGLTVGSDSVGWNLNGNLDNSVNASFTYDFDNKLRFATADSNSIEIRYDPRGNRIYKGIRDSEGDIVKERKYIVDIVGRLPVILCEIDPNNSSLTNKYYYANSQILAQDAAYLTDPNDPNSTDYYRYYYLHDRLGSVRQVVDCNALTVATYTYNPYGEDFAEDCNDVAIYNPFKYTGQWFDSEIAQYYLRARQYDPKMMRFSGRDPVKGENYEPMTLHAYMYCMNNPVNRTDPSGEISIAMAEGLKYATGVYAAGLNIARFGAEIGDFDLILAGGAIMELNPIGFVYGYMKGSGITQVSRWGRSGLKKGDWVMKGKQSRVNYWMSGKWKRGWGNQYAPRSSGQSWCVNGGDLSVPPGFKGFLSWLFNGQMKFTP